VVDLTNTILIATSNLGAEIIQRHIRVHGEAQDDEGGLRRELMVVLRGHFRPEFLNRIDEIIVFHALTREQIRAIVTLQLERVKRSAHGQGIELVVDDSLVEHLGQAGLRPEFGVRELRRLIRSELETQLARAVLADELHEGDRVAARRDGGEQKVVLEPQGRSPGGTAGAAASGHENAVELHRDARREAGDGGAPAAAE
jgi:ATP-dependent Clp protease ATP-binding subunit ClpC